MISFKSRLRGRRKPIKQMIDNMQPRRRSNLRSRRVRNVAARCLLIWGIGISSMLAHAAADNAPNLVILLADDAGYADFGFQPNCDDDVVGLTPHLDSLASDGVRFQQFYMSACVCSPARAGLLTGRYQQRFGHETNIAPGYMDGGLPLSETTLADRLHSAGYVTGLIGKWHLGYPPDYHPNARGFDYFFGCLQGSRSYFPIDDPSPHRVILENRTPTSESGYLTDRLGAAAVQFVEQHRQEPFFLLVSFTAPHAPHHAKDEDLALPEIARIENEKRRKFVAMIKALDDNVGEILAVLDRCELSDNTLVVFLNDNGGQTQYQAANTPLRGRKGTFYEGGVRVPSCWRWPEVLPPGGVVDELCSSLDLVPTLLAAATGTSEPPKQCDGINLLPYLTDPEQRWPERALYWRHGPEGPTAIRKGEWKLLIPEPTAPVELYHLPSDIAEQINLADEQPERVMAMTTELRHWHQGLVEPLWGFE